MSKVRIVAHAFAWTYRHLKGRLRVPEVRTIALYLNSNSVCFDVGANAGSWSIELARVVPSGHVYAFEALPYYAEVLAYTLRMMRQKRVTIVNKAVVENESQVRMVRKDSQGELLTGKVHVATAEERPLEEATVQAVTLDSFWRSIGERQVDFIKCDVEGYELFVLRGARNMVEKCRPVIYSELNSEWCTRYDYRCDDVFDFFERLDYSPFYVGENSSLIGVSRRDHSNGDILFVPRERTTAS